MKFSTTAIFAALAFIASSAPVEPRSDGKYFGLITIHSGSPVQYSGLYIADDNTIQLGGTGSQEFVGKFNDDGTISVRDTYFLNHNGNNVLSIKKHSSNKFSVVDTDHLSYDGSTAFTAKYDGTKYSIVTGNAVTTTDDVAVLLKVIYN